MNWTKLSAIAEILSSVAILVTLAFLTVEMRQNTVAVQASSLDGALQADVQHLYTIVEDPDLWASFYKDELSDREKIRLFHFLAAMAKMRERNWLQYDSGALNEADWLAYQGGFLGTLAAPQPRKWWEGVNRRDEGIFNPGFVETINAELAT